MKAVDYYNKYKEGIDGNSDDYNFFIILQEMLLEISSIAKLRSANSDRALKAIFNEQELKCQSFIKMVNKDLAESGKDLYKEDSFKIFLESVKPELFKMVFNQ